MQNKTLANARRLRLGWAAVFAANLIVPLLLGCMVTAGGGRAGMLVAMGLLWLLGHEGSGRVRNVGFVLIGGGSGVALSQLFPFLQFFAGMFSLTVGQRLGLVVEAETTGELGGFLVTLMTGSLLIAVAALLGLVLRVVFPPADRKEVVDDDWAIESSPA
jgi:hypothetical protein